MFDGDGFLVGQPIFRKQFTKEQNPLLWNEMVNIHGLETARMFTCSVILILYT